MRLLPHLLQPVSLHLVAIPQSSDPRDRSLLASHLVKCPRALSQHQASLPQVQVQTNTLLFPLLFLRVPARSRQGYRSRQALISSILINSTPISLTSSIPISPIPPNSISSITTNLTSLIPTRSISSIPTSLFSPTSLIPILLRSISSILLHSISLILLRSISPTS